MQVIIIIIILLVNFFLFGSNLIDRIILGRTLFKSRDSSILLFGRPHDRGHPKNSTRIPDCFTFAGMTNEMIRHLLPDDFSDQSKVWIYQSSRRITEQQQAEVGEQLHQFASQWLSHGEQVKGWAKLLFGQFIVVLADMSVTQVGGCSTDSMQRIIKSLERQYDTKLFDRLSLTFLVDETPQILPLNQVQYALDKGFIQMDTPLFDNTITDLKALKTRWLIPINESWLAPRLNQTEQA